VLDATDVAGPPVAAVTLPRGVPSGFHGAWIPDGVLPDAELPEPADADRTG
jgi:carotenoid cleavage dioxygenase